LFLITKKSSVFGKYTKSEMNKPQAEGNANSPQYSRAALNRSAILDCRRIWHGRKHFNIITSAI